MGIPSSMPRPRPALALFLAWTLLGPAAAWAARVDITADSIRRTAEGVVIAEGHVVVRRETETLEADEVRYRPGEHRLRARGNVRLDSPRGRLRAAQLSLDTQSRQGTVSQAELELPDGSRISARRLVRENEHTWRGDEVRFTTCPKDETRWQLRARTAVLDQEEGELTARGARFELGGIPVLATPYWRQPLKRKSGILLPQVGVSSRRGTEWALPLYLAPRPNWDATLTPRWMTARGLMGELELRHASLKGSERIAGELLRDRQTRTMRGRITGDAHYSFGHGLRLRAQGDHVSDPDYLADYGRDQDPGLRYLTSEASLEQTGRNYSWALSARHQQDLALASNATTLQILPRLESRVAFALGPAHLHLDQQSTRFFRRQGVHGWRVDLNPWLELPWRLAGGGLSARLFLGHHHTRYWLQQAARKRLARDVPYGGAELSATFERISADRRWRHALSPRLRLDLARAPDQSGFPNFDSAFGRLSWSNLFASSRFSGLDRIENARRLSAILDSSLMHRGDRGPAREVFRLALGASLEMRPGTIDPALKPAPARRLSNLLARIMLAPASWMTLSADGVIDAHQRFLATGTASLTLAHAGFSLNATHRHTDARYAAQIRQTTGRLALPVSSRWRLEGSWQYDHLLKFTQRAEAGIVYRHPCWGLTVQGFRLNRASQGGRRADVGGRLLLEFKGLGSVGS